MPVTTGERQAYQRVITEQIDQIAAFFGFDAQATPERLKPGSP